MHMLHVLLPVGREGLAEVLSDVDSEDSLLLVDVEGVEQPATLRRIVEARMIALERHECAGIILEDGHGKHVVDNANRTSGRCFSAVR